MKKLLIIFAASILGMVACNDKVELKNEKVSMDGLKMYSTTRMLTDLQVDSIALLHNTYLERAFQNRNFNDSDHQQALYYRYINLGQNDFNITLNEAIEYLDSSDNDNLTSYTTNIDLIGIINDISNFIDLNSNSTFSQIQNEVEDRVAYAHQILSGSDLDVALVFLKTFEKSSYFWMPQSQGGSGLGEIILLDFEDDFPGVSINWGAIALADGSGAAGVLLRTWYLASWGPLSWGAIVGACAWGASWGSVSALCIQLGYS